MIVRQITREDYGYTSDYKWSENRMTPSKNAYYSARKLTKDQIEKIVEMDSLIGYEVGFLIGKKIYRAVILAVSLPDSEVTAHPSGEIRQYDGKEFARIFRSYPYEFYLQISGRLGFWSRRVDNVDISMATKTDLSYIKFKDIEEATSIYC